MKLESNGDRVIKVFDDDGRIVFADTVDLYKARDRARFGQELAGRANVTEEWAQNAVRTLLEEHEARIQETGKDGNTSLVIDVANAITKDYHFAQDAGGKLYVFQGGVCASRHRVHPEPGQGVVDRVG